ncbi:MAG: hypothetical protein U5R31_08545 [Acidimicrobiia bacterium]|nr:hypothetical protein [Acidimicrobiia bacterium]
MPMNHPRLTDLVAGAAAGIVGTIAMDTLWWRRSRRSGSTLGFAEWDFATGTDYDSFDDAPRPPGSVRGSRVSSGSTSRSDTQGSPPTSCTGRRARVGEPQRDRSPRCIRSLRFRLGSPPGWLR